MKVGLIDVDSHNFPNLALMKLSAYHKAAGDSVEWWYALEQYDRVYMSKVFDNTYSPDIPEPMNAREIIKGGNRKRIDHRGLRAVCLCREHHMQAHTNESEFFSAHHLEPIRLDDYLCRIHHMNTNPQ